MKTLSESRILEAAAYALLAERCRASHLHDIRGALQPLNSAVELLVRAAKKPEENSALAEKAAALARRALTNHEKSLLEFMDQVTPQAEIASSVNAGEMLRDVLRFINNDAASKSVIFHLRASPDVVVAVDAHRFRLLMLGLSITLCDIADHGSVITVTVAKTDLTASIQFRANTIPSSPGADLAQVLGSSDSGLSLYDLIMILAGRWTTENGGRLDLVTGLDLPDKNLVCLQLRAVTG